MKEFFRRVKSKTKEFNRAKSKYIFLFLNSGLVAFGILLTLCSWLTGLVLKKAGIPYITHTTIPLFLEQPWAIVALLAILLLLVYVSYFEYSMILIGMRDIKNNNYSFKKSFIDGFKVIKSTTPKAMLVLSLYIVLALPLAGLLGDDFNLFSKVQIPKFIEDFMLGKWYLAIILFAVYLFATFFAIKYMLVLPGVVLKDMSVKEALSESAKNTHGKIFSIFWKIIIISIKFALTEGLFFIIAYVLQLLFDTFLADYADVTAAIILSAITIFEMYYPLELLVTTLYTIIPDDYFEYTEEMNAQKELTKVNKKEHVFPLIVLVTLTVIFSAISSYTYIFEMLVTDPYVISHRGVDGKNGVQNTLPAMEATIKSSHPDYIEIDIHETKDGKFVLMHDENLKALCGVDEIPHNLTLAELTSLDASENGFTAKLCSLDECLELANKYDQKLLIEIKTTNYDSDEMLDNFFYNYGTEIVEHGHKLHSMTYSLVEEICGSDLVGHETEPYFYEGQPIFMGCIIPYNVLYPNTNASGYTMEETTLNSSIVKEAFAEGKEIYAWTVNTEDDMRKMALTGVDGIITDEPSLLREQLNGLNEAGYAMIISQKFSDMSAT